jgi:hypothetical protein
VLKLYMGGMMASVFEFGIRTMDKMGLEVHLVRLLYLTVFDVDLRERSSYPAVLSDPSMAIDLGFLLFIIMPQFICALRYLAQPMTWGPYKSKYNALLAPLAVIPLFFFSDWDICFLSVQVLAMNLWVSWRQMDAGDDEFSWMQYFRDYATAQSFIAGGMSGVLASNFGKSVNVDKAVSDTYEALSMMSDPATA